jgi:serine/threonine protein phosphatase PrpC
MMQQATTDPGFFYDANLAAPRLFEFSGGTAALFSQRCPDKDTANEDSVALVPTGPTSGVIAVADGCGGMALGEVASRAAIEALRWELAESDATGPMMRAAILDGLERANREVCEVGWGSATTIAIVEVDGTMLRTYHVGDSAILLMGSRGRVKLHTTSHSPVGYAVQAGVLDARAAIHHQDRHLVSNVLGTRDFHIEVGTRRKLSALDTVVVGSDGLFDNLHIDEIVDISRKGPLLLAAERLAELATERMQQFDADQPCKPDDLTFVLFRPRRAAR